MATYLSDSFTDTNGTQLVSHTIPTKRGSQTWDVDNAGPGDTAAVDGDVLIQSNKVEISRDGAGAFVDVGAAVFAFSVDWTTGGSTGHRVQIYVRRTDKSNHVYAVFREPNDDIIVYKVVAGVTTQLATVAYTFATSTTYTLTLTHKAGNLLDVSVNGVVQIANTDISAVTSTNLIGFARGFNPGGVATFDNFLVTNNATQTVSAASNPKPGDTLALTFANWIAAPSTITVNSVSEAFSGTPTTSAGTMAAIPLTDFVLGGHHAATRWNTNVTLTVSDGIDSANATIQIANPTLVAGTNDFAARSGTQYYPPPGSADGDDFYVTWDSGGGTLSAAGAYFLPTSLPAQGQVRWYDVSAVSWQALYLTDYFSAAAGIIEGIVMSAVRPIVKSVVEVIT